MKKVILFFLPFLLYGFLFSCSSSSKQHFTTIVTYDTVHKASDDCPMIRLIFTTGFDNSQIIINWNNTIIYNGTVSTDKIKGVALQSISIPKNPGNINVKVDGIEIDKTVDTEYCNMLYHKSGDSLFLEFTNRKIYFD